MAIKLKGPGRAVLFGLLVVAVFLAIIWYKKQPKTVGESATIGNLSIPDVPEASLTGTAAVKLPLPSTTQALNGGLRIVHNEMAWQSQNGWHLAAGGIRTTKGSLFDKVGLDVSIKRQDDCAKSVADMVTYIKDYKNGVTKDGFFITFMGSGADFYIANIFRLVEKLGPEYAPVIFMTSGKSYGEDQVIGDIKFKQDPQNLKGAVVRGVRADGDLDLAIKFAGDNGIKVNQNDKIYDPNALNLSYSNTHLSAVNDYNSNLNETRKIVRNGKVTDQDTAVSYDLVATWTPGDVNAIIGGGDSSPRGGVTIISTKKYASIMPNATIGCRKFLNDNRTKIDDMIGAIATAGDQIRSYEDVKRYACKLTSQIFAEKDEAYWYKYYNGFEKDRNTYLGGSMVFNLADMCKIFGVNGSSDIYKEVYTTFSTIHSKLYPEDLPTPLPYSKAVDKSFLASVASNHPELLEGKALQVQYASEITEKVASKDVTINFNTGSAIISPSSYSVLDELYSAATTAEGLKVGIYGHTDNTGNSTSNMQLSADRAESVRQYLIKKGLPENRIESKGFGDTQPKETNSTTEGKAANRRVQIVLGS